MHIKWIFDRADDLFETRKSQQDTFSVLQVDSYRLTVICLTCKRRFKNANLCTISCWNLSKIITNSLIRAQTAVHA